MNPGGIRPRVPFFILPKLVKMVQFRLLLVCVFLSSANQLLAQKVAVHLVETNFAQSRINFDAETGELSNILKIRNRSETAVVAKVRLFMSENWSLIFALPEEIVVPPNGEITYLSLDIAVPENTPGGTMHRLVAQVSTAEGQSIGTAVCGVTIPAVSSWKVWSEKSEIYIPAQRKMLPVQLILKNTGNVPETFYLKFQQHPNVIIARGIRKNLTLAPGEDTSLFYEAHYIPPSKPLEQVSIRFEAGHEGSDKTEKGYLNFLFLKNEYNHLDTKSKNVSAEIFAGNLNPANEWNSGVRTAGNIPVGKDGEIRFKLDAKNLSDPKDENTLYAIQYEGKNLKLESRNGRAKVSWGQEKNTFEKWTVSALQNFKSGTTQLQYSRQQLLDRTRLNGRVGFFNAPKAKQQTGLFYLSAQVPVFQKSQLVLNFNDVYVKNRGSENPYHANAFRYFLQFDGNHSANWQTQLKSSYASAHYSFGGRNLLNLNGRIKYQSLNQKHRFQLFLFMDKKLPKAYEKGQLLAPESYTRNGISMNYRCQVFPQVSLELGGGWEQFKGDRYSALSGTQLSHQQQMTEVVVTAAWKRYIWLNLKHRRQELGDFISPKNLYEYHQIPVFKTTSIRGRIQKEALSLDYDFHHMDDRSGFFRDTLHSDLRSKKTHSVDLTYQTKWVRTGIKFLSEEQNDRLIVPLHFQGELFRRSLKWKFSANALHFFGTSTTTFFSRTVLDWQIKNGWHLLAKAQYNQKSQAVSEAEEGTLSSRSTKVELGVKKDFHVDPSAGKAFDITIRCFKDENGNGDYDEREAPMPDVRLHLSPQKDSLFATSQFREAAIFSGADGDARFRNLPIGTYQLSVHQVFADKEGYFSTTSETRKVELTADHHLNLSFGKGKVIEGKVTLKRDDHSSYKSLPLKGIRINATDATGRSFSALTDKKGNFKLYVPYSHYYLVVTKNPYGEDFELKKESHKVIFTEGETPFVEFVIEESAVEIEWD